MSKLDIKLTQADEIIEMGEAVGTAIRKKKNSSIVLTVDAVAKGSSDAVVAAGSTITKDVDDYSLAIARVKEINKKNYYR